MKRRNFLTAILAALGCGATGVPLPCGGAQPNLEAGNLQKQSLPTPLLRYKRMVLDSFEVSPHQHDELARIQHLHNLELARQIFKP